MYGPTRGTITLIGAAVAGFLLWLAVQFAPGDDTFTNGEYWTIVGLIAAAGLVMALSQLLGGWTKWGWPRISGSVFVLAFLPVLIVAGWVLIFGQPESNWLEDHVTEWSSDIGIEGVLRDLINVVPVLAFGIGLVFGLVFDTSGPRTTPIFRRRREVVAEGPPTREAEATRVGEEAAAPATPARERLPEAETGVLRPERETADDRRIEIREGGTSASPEPPRDRDPERRPPE